MPERPLPFKFSAIVLCGGRSQRMGFDKFRLPIGEQTFLERIVETLMETVGGPVICVANSQSAPVVLETLKSIQSDRVRVVADHRDDSGPLEGIRVGLQTAGEFSPWALVSSCDVPMIPAALSEKLQEMAESTDENIEAIVPCSEERVFGMTAMYRTDAHRKIDALIEQDCLRVSGLASALSSTIVDIESLRNVDPQLDSVRNLNLPSQYLRFLAEKGFPCPPEIQQRLSSDPEDNSDSTIKPPKQ